jgi:hypothetical protein
VEAQGPRSTRAYFVWDENTWWMKDIDEVVPIRKSVFIIAINDLPGARTRDY